MTSLFHPGTCAITPGANDALNRLGIAPATLIDRHLRGDWIGLDTEDQEANRVAVEQGKRIFSTYTYSDQTFYVITEWDRSSTTVLLNHDY